MSQPSLKLPPLSLSFFQPPEQDDDVRGPAQVVDVGVGGGGGPGGGGARAQAGGAQAGPGARIRIRRGVGEASYCQVRSADLQKT